MTARNTTLSDLIAACLTVSAQRVAATNTTESAALYREERRLDAEIDAWTFRRCDA